MSERHYSRLEKRTVEIWLCRPPTMEPYRGRAGVRTYWRRATATQSDLDLRFGRPIVDGDRAAVEWWATMNDPEWGSPRDDAAATLPGCLMLRFTDESLR